MSIVSPSFLFLIFATVFIYYLVPSRHQWKVLLAASILFYIFAGWSAALFVLITATTIYAATRLIPKYPKKDKRRKAIYLSALLINLAILFAFKYIGFALSVIAPFLPSLNTSSFSLSLIVPLGISYYTLQSIGYLTDVYWGNVAPEKNYAKALLFVCFFPQMTQGPISDFKQLSGELYTPHKFDYKNISWGFWRMVWGFAKKLILADYLYMYTEKMFDLYSDISGLATFILIFFYAIEIYADFSGYMDIVCGASEMLGIKLSENFIRPYFSKNVSEYWRRWHITMGVWFKKYVYYPVATSRLNQGIAKKLRKHTSRHFTNTLTASLALTVTWFVTGLWHKATAGYIAWGLINGALIIAALWLEPVFIKAKKICKINEDAPLWRAFSVCRTFFIISIVKVLPDAHGLANGLGLVSHAFTARFLPGEFNLWGFIPYYGSWYTLWAGIGMIVLIFVVDLLSRKCDVREYIFRLPFAVRIIVISLLLLAIVAWGSWSSDVGFMYAQF